MPMRAQVQGAVKADGTLGLHDAVAFMSGPRAFGFGFRV